MIWKSSIFLADLNPTIGSEQRGRRPVLVVSDEDFNQVMSVVTVLPITSLKPGRRVYPNEILLETGTAGLAVTSLALAHQIRTIAKDRLVVQLGIIAEKEILNRVVRAIRVHLNL